MKKVVLNFIAGLIILSITSCGTKVNTESITKLNELDNILLETELQLSSLNKDSIREVYDNLKENEKIITAKLTDLPEDKTLVNKLAALATNSKIIKHYFRDTKKYVDEVELSKSQLKTLRNDLENGLILDEEFEKFYKEESKAISDLKIEVNICIGNTKRELKIYKSISPDISILIDSLSNIK